MGRASRRAHLEDDEAEGEGVDLGGELAILVLGRHVHERTQDAHRLHVRRRRGARLVDRAREAEVADASDEAAVEQHVGGLDVAMDHLRVRVEVGEAAGDVGEDEDALARGERAAAARARKAIVQRAALHESVHEARLRAVQRRAEERHDVGVHHLRQHAHLRRQLLRARQPGSRAKGRVLFEHLHSNLSARGQPPAVHVAEAAAAELRARHEATRRR